MGVFYEKEIKRGNYIYWIIGDVGGVPEKEIQVYRKKKKDEEYELRKEFPAKVPIHVVLDFCDDDSDIEPESEKENNHRKKLESLHDRILFHEKEIDNLKQLIIFYQGENKE